MGGSIVFSFIGGGGSHVRKPDKEGILPPEPESVANMLREAKGNLVEVKDSPFPNPDDTCESSEDKDGGEEKN